MKNFKFFGYIFFLSSIIFTCAFTCCLSGDVENQKSIVEKNNQKKDVAIVVISNNCPIKLYACLESIKTYVKGYNKIFVFYYASDDIFEKAYKEVGLDFSDVTMLRLKSDDEDSNLKRSLYHLLSQKIEPKYVAISVDNIIVNDFVDLNDCALAIKKSGAYGCCLSLGKNITHDSIVSLKITKSVSDNIISWSIRDSVGDGYINPLDMVVYNRGIILKDTFLGVVRKKIKDLKTAWAHSIKKNLNMLCFYKSKAVNLTPLILQNETIEEEATKDFLENKLLSIFNSGFKININTFYGMENKESSIAYEVSFVPRKDGTDYLWNKLKDKKPREDKHFVFVIASYNNKQWYKPNLDSVISQKYKNYNVIYVDDMSTDGTGELVEQYIKERKLENKILLIKNQERLGAVANIYRAVHMCDDKSIIIILDGDDWLAHDHVLDLLNKIYDDSNIWLTYGQYKCFPFNARSANKNLPPDIISENKFREYSWVTSHLRTFYAWLYKKIKIDDLMFDGKFMPMSGDLAIMFPMLEMSGDRIMFINDILLVYNADNILNDHKVDASLQVSLNKYIRTLPRYSKL